MYRMFDLYVNNGISEKEYLDWTQRNLNAAILNIKRRKEIDVSGYEKRWKELEGIRKTKEGLPDED